MLFNSYEFLLVFLPIVITVFYFSLNFKDKRLPIIWLTFASVAFYGYWNIKFLILLVVSILFNYSIGCLLGKSKYHYINKKYILYIGIFLNLLVLSYYKYYNFFLSNVSQIFQTSFSVENIILPIGISFFTFTQIAFLVDVYKGIAKEYKLVSYILFVTFFPHLIAGPILHHKEMMPQFEKDDNFNINWANICIGTAIFVLGLFKKIIVADRLAEIATPIFIAVNQGGIPQLLESWIAALTYSFQLYYDFSGYSDMAIGLALMFNIKLPVNFFSPYKAISIIDFWRRWHMTLSRYLRDYVYIPLGGNRNGEYNKLKNLFITMLIGGLWHGAGWTFIIWGGLHGIYLIINHAYRKYKFNLSDNLNWLLTFISVVIAWVIFRADNVNDAILIIQGMFGFNGIETNIKLSPLTNISFVKTFGIIFTILFIIKKMPNVLEIFALYKPALEIDESKIETKFVKYIKWEPNYLWSLIIAIIAIISILSMSKTSEFLYFQF